MVKTLLKSQIGDGIVKILVINAGSSTYKLALFDIKDNIPIVPIWTGLIDWGKKDQSIKLVIHAEKKVIEFSVPSIDEGLIQLLKSICEGETKVLENLYLIERIGHRVVHGGEIFIQPTIIDDEVKQKIKSLIPLAPLHNPANLKGIEWAEKMFPNVVQVAVFDTAFHATLPEEVRTYPLPIGWKEEGIIRYGFHGISHQYCAQRICTLENKDKDDLKIVNCHLGNGCSLCAIRDGMSVNTTMGMTPMEGLMMGTRSGSIDPGIILYLLHENIITAERLDFILNFESGIKGICGTSDMRDVEKSMGTDYLCDLAFKMFVYRLKSSIASMVCYQEGIDVLSFTGGIGENSSAVRKAVCNGLEFMGITLDEEKNESALEDKEISAPSSKTKIWVLHTQEEWMIAKESFSK